MLVAGSARLDPEGGVQRWSDAIAQTGLVTTSPVPLDHPFKSVQGADPVRIVVLAEDEPDPDVYRLIDRSQESLCPMLVLIPAALARLAPMFTDQGVMTLPIDADPVRIACSALALDARQPLVRRLSTELSLAQLSVRGAIGEMGKLQEEMQTAASIQRQHMPASIPSVEGLEIGVVYRPATYVSGDIYDIARLDEHRTAFFIADAVGHGVPAALMTMIISCGLSKVDGVGENSRIVPPGEALLRLNNAMTERSGGSAQFATAVYGIFDSSTSEVTIAGAGHPPPLIVRKGGVSIDRIEPDGPLLGIFSGAEFGESTVTLEPGDLLVLFSDGFEVAFPSDGAQGDDFKRPTLTYLDKLAQTGSDGITLDAAVATLESELDNASGSLHQPDDITALFIAPCGTTSEVGSPAA